MEVLNGRLIYSEGDRLFVRIPKKDGRIETVELEAVKATRDDYYCYDCCLFSACNEWESKIGGNSPIGRCCYSTIFKESKLLPEKKIKRMRKRK
ncbi:MAG: hypothetical protein IIT58_00355 [Treponema sp.]|nr:hypothetical protein [Treponema sp.]